MPKTYSSLRVKKRYVFFRVLSDGPVSYSDLKNAAFGCLLEWMGEESFGKADVTFIRNLWDSRSRTGVLRCSHRFVDHVKLGLSMMHQTGDHRLSIQTLRVSGTIKGGRSKIRV